MRPRRTEKNEEVFWLSGGGAPAAPAARGDRCRSHRGGRHRNRGNLRAHGSDDEEQKHHQENRQQRTTRHDESSQRTNLNETDDSATNGSDRQTERRAASARSA